MAEKTLYDVKPGDKVCHTNLLCSGEWEIVDRVTKLYIIIGARKYRKSNGKMVVPSDIYDTNRIEIYKEN